VFRWPHYIGHAPLLVVFQARQVCGTGNERPEQSQSLQSVEGIWAEAFSLKWSTTPALGSQKGEGRFRGGGRHASQTSATWLILSVALCVQQRMRRCTCSFRHAAVAALLGQVAMLQTLTMTHYQHPALDGPNELGPSCQQLPSSTQGACRAAARAEQMLACLACAGGRSSRSSSCSGSRSSASQDDLQPLLQGTVAICGAARNPWAWQALCGRGAYVIGQTSRSCCLLPPPRPGRLLQPRGPPQGGSAARSGTWPSTRRGGARRGELLAPRSPQRACRIRGGLLTSTQPAHEATGTRRAGGSRCCCAWRASGTRCPCAPACAAWPAA
jgi:hypothetical protein